MEDHLSQIHLNVRLSDRNVNGRLMVFERSEKEPPISRIRTWQTITKTDPAADSLKYSEPRQRESLDATVRYASSYKDRGKFGSHPGHDDFGDDSKP